MYLTKETAQALLAEARYLDTKNPKKHDMRVFVEPTPCGSTSCALGDMAISGALGLRVNIEGDLPVFGDEGYPDIGFNAAVVALKISSPFVLFLFDASGRVGVSRSLETPQQTAARIRKFVYYFLHKQDILSDYEGARRTGDIGVSDKVLESVEKDLQLA